jgi:altronate hydrolase
MKKNVLKINPKDNVWVALQNIAKGSVVSIGEEQVTVLEDIAAKHKIYPVDFKKGDAIFMYGVLVGKLTMDVAAGTRMSTENLHHAAEPLVLMRVVLLMDFTEQMAGLVPLIIGYLYPLCFVKTEI